MNKIISVTKVNYDDVKTMTKRYQHLLGKLYPSIGTIIKFKDKYIFCERISSYLQEEMAKRILKFFNNDTNNYFCRKHFKKIYVNKVNLIGLSNLNIFIKANFKFLPSKEQYRIMKIYSTMDLTNFEETILESMERNIRYPYKVMQLIEKKKDNNISMKNVNSYIVAFFLKQFKTFDEETNIDYNNSHRLTIIGGMMDKDETVEETLFREVREEINLDLSKVNFRIHDSFLMDVQDRMNKNIYSNLTFLLEITDPDFDINTLKINSTREISKIYYYKFSNFQALLKYILEKRI